MSTCVTFTDCRIRGDRVIDPRPPTNDYLVMTGCQPWSHATEEAVIHGDLLCPICGGRPRMPSHYCACDDRAGRDHLFGVPGRPSRYPGEAVDSRLNAGWTATPTSYEGPPPNLNGGMTGRVRTRRERRAG